MGKIKITKKQYEAILLHEQEARLKLIKSTINEEEKDKDALSKEISDLVFILAKLLGKELTGQNKIYLEKALSDKAKLKTLKEMLEDSEKTKKLIDALVSKGMNNPSEKIGKNALKIVDEFNKLDNEIQLDDKAIHNLLSLVHK